MPHMYESGKASKKIFPEHAQWSRGCQCIWFFFRAGRMVQLQQKNLPFCSYIVSNPSHNYKQAQTDSDRLDIDWAELCIQESIIWTRNCSNNGLHWLVSTFLCVVLLNHLKQLELWESDCLSIFPDQCWPRLNLFNLNLFIQKYATIFVFCFKQPLTSYIT